MSEKIRSQELPPDDYRWLEDIENPKVQAWIDKQNEVTDSQFRERIDYEGWKPRVERYIKLERETLPVRRKNKYFYTHQRPDDDFPVVLVKDGESGEPQSLVNLNEYEMSATPALEYWRPSRDGSILAYALSEGGSEIMTLKFLDVTTGKEIYESIPNVGGMSWNDDNKSFYYERKPEPGTVDDNDLRMHAKVYLHELGKNWREDPLIFGEGRSPEDIYQFSRGDNAPYLAIAVWSDWQRNDVYLLDMASREVKPYITDLDSWSDVSPLEDELIIITGHKANNRHILAGKYEDLAGGVETAKVLIPESDIPIESYDISKSYLFVKYNRDLADEVFIYDHSGKEKGRLPTPELSLAYVRTSLEDDEVYYGFETMVNAGAHYKFNPETFELEKIYEVKTPHNPEDYEYKREWTLSADGTKLPLLVAHKKGLHKNGTNPTILYGYGGFGTSEDPSYIGTYMSWLDEGGVFADGVLRGGGEYGEEWHRAGILENKQKSFDDFIAHAEKLIEDGYTSSEHLGIMGGSNGGLLVGAVAMQRPELYKAVASLVPLMDMVNFPHLLIASRWMSEYGDPSKPEDLERILQWSPYHNVHDGVDYPTFYITSAENDTRVHPMHALKMTAKLQQVGARAMLEVERDAGHTGSQPRRKRIENIARRLSFFDWQLS